MRFKAWGDWSFSCFAEELLFSSSHFTDHLSAAQERMDENAWIRIPWTLWVKSHEATLVVPK